MQKHPSSFAPFGSDFAHADFIIIYFGQNDIDFIRSITTINPIVDVHMFKHTLDNSDDMNLLHATDLVEEEVASSSFSSSSFISFLSLLQQQSSWFLYFCSSVPCKDIIIIIYLVRMVSILLGTCLLLILLLMHTCLNIHVMVLEIFVLLCNISSVEE